jgi:hypothetical protein
VDETARRDDKDESLKTNVLEISEEDSNEDSKEYVELN